MGFLDRSNSGGGGLSLTTTVSLNIISNISMRTTTPFVSFCNLRTKFYLQWPWIDSFEISFHCVRNFLFNNSAWVNSCFNIDSQAKFTWCVFCSFSPSKFPAFVFFFFSGCLSAMRIKSYSKQKQSTTSSGKATSHIISNWAGDYYPRGVIIFIPQLTKKAKKHQNASHHTGAMKETENFESSFQFLKLAAWKHIKMISF